MLTKLIEKLNHERKNAIKNGIYHLIQIKFSYNSNCIEGSGLTYDNIIMIFFITNYIFIIIFFVVWVYFTR